MSGVFGELYESLQQVLAYRMGWSELREVQERTYRAVTAGNNVMVIAPTAGGKTEAALIPVVDMILKGGLPGVACVYISPLKALINDQEDRFLDFALPTGLEVLKWHGDVPKGDRSWTDGESPHFLMITPESLEVLMLEQELSKDLKNVKFVIIDEVHAFVESERGVHLRVLLERLDRISGTNVQRIGLSATVGNPEEILSWLSGPRGSRELVQLPVPAREKRFLFVTEPDDTRRMEALARVVAGKKVLVFVNSRSDAEVVTRALRGKVEHLSVHHSSLSPEIRRAAEEAFSREGSACIICTSTLELGIDIGDLDIVVQMGPPNSVSSFLQRMGRSGRRGKPPFVASIMKDPWELLIMVAVIECASKKEVEPLIPDTIPYNVLVQQIFLELCRTMRTSRARILSQLAGLSPFSGISRETIEEILSYLVDQGFMVSDGDLLMPGPAAEKLYGQSNWKDLYSVIKGGGEFRAVTPDGETVGRLDARFVAGRAGSSFSLGGRNWTLVKSDESHNLVVVVPGEEQKSKTFWTGGQSGYSPVICRAVQRILARGGSVLPLGEEDSGDISDIAGQLPHGLKAKGLFVWEHQAKSGTEVSVLAFRGRNANGVLATVLTGLLGSRVKTTYSDFSIDIQGLKGEDQGERVADALRHLTGLDKEEVAPYLPTPSPDNWKFGQALPGHLVREMALADSYHVEEFVKEMNRTRVILLQPGFPGE